MERTRCRRHQSSVEKWKQQNCHATGSSYEGKIGNSQLRLLIDFEGLSEHADQQGDTGRKRKEGLEWKSGHLYRP